MNEYNQVVEMEYNGKKYTVSNEPEDIKNYKLQNTINANGFKEIFGTEVTFDLKNKKAYINIL